MQALIAALDEEVTADGGQLVVLLIPTRWEILRTEPWAFELDELVAFLEEERPGVYVVDPRPALREPEEGSPAEMYFEFNGAHWSPAGHALIADVLYDTLLNEGLVTYQ